MYPLHNGVVAKLALTDSLSGQECTAVQGLLQEPSVVLHIKLVIHAPLRLADIRRLAIALRASELAGAQVG
jgi:hypothetical protein